jgi:hypothetical protein
LSSGAGVGVVLAAVMACGCGGSASGSGSPAAGEPPVARAGPATVATTTYDTRLERGVAHAFEAAYLAAAVVRAPTESQIPPRITRMVGDPATVCTRQRSGDYRCSVTYRLPSGPPVNVLYEARRRHGCITATSVAMPAASPLHRLGSC